MGIAVRLPLFGVPAGPGAIEQAPARADDRGIVQLGLF